MAVGESQERALADLESDLRSRYGCTIVSRRVIENTGEENESSRSNSTTATAAAIVLKATDEKRKGANIIEKCHVFLHDSESSINNDHDNDFSSSV